MPNQDRYSQLTTGARSTTKYIATECLNNGCNAVYQMGVNTKKIDKPKGWSYGFKIIPGMEYYY
jgi:hypothetical protein